MVKARIHITGYCYMDEEVFIEVNLPCLPPINSWFIIEGDNLDKLMTMATKNTEVASRYFPDWFYGRSEDIQTLTDDNLHNLDFTDAVYVIDHSFNPDDDFVKIELGKHPKPIEITLKR